MMKLVASYLALLAVALQICFAQSTGIRLGEPRPAHGAARLSITPMAGQVPATLEELSRRSSLIVDGTVKSTLPPRETSPRALETDAIVTVNRVLKGPVGVRETLISQRGGVRGELFVTPTQYSIVRPGERYILFLVEDRRPNIPAVEGMTRYLVTGIWSGLFLFENGNMRVKAEQPDSLRKRYEGLTVEQVTTAIAEALRR